MASSRINSPLLPGGSDSLVSSSTITDFQIERIQKGPSKRRSIASDRGYDETLAYRDFASHFIAAKNRPFSVSGRIPLDTSQLVLFFRSKSGITHSLDFPIDVEYNNPPALDVLIAACRPHRPDNAYHDGNESFYYPPNLPLGCSFDIANHPILDAVRATLFPLLPPDHHLTAMRDKLEIVLAGGRMGIQPPSTHNDGRSATIVVTLPVRFRGGALVVHDPHDPVHEEKYNGRNGKDGDVEWTAFLPDCEYEVEMVQRGCRLLISYAVFLRHFDSVGGVEVPDAIVQPSDRLLDLLAPILNMSRGKKVGFYLINDYDVNPAETYADSLIPLLKSGDLLLYQCIRLYKLTPELHWTAGGYLWPMDRLVDFLADDPDDATSNQGQPGSKDPKKQTSKTPAPSSTTTKTQSSQGQRGSDVPPMRGLFAASYSDETGSPDKSEYVRTRVEDSGAISITEANVAILLDWNDPSGNQVIGKQRVFFVSKGEMEKLVVNALLVAYVP